MPTPPVALDVLNQKIADYRRDIHAQAAGADRWSYRLSAVSIVVTVGIAVAGCRLYRGFNTVKAVQVRNTALAMISLLVAQGGVVFWRASYSKKVDSLSKKLAKYLKQQKKHHGARVEQVAAEMVANDPFMLGRCADLIQKSAISKQDVMRKSQSSSARLEVFHKEIDDPFYRHSMAIGVLALIGTGLIAGVLYKKKAVQEGLAGGFTLLCLTFSAAITLQARHDEAKRHAARDRLVVESWAGWFTDPREVKEYAQGCLKWARHIDIAKAGFTPQEEEAFIQGALQVRELTCKTGRGISHLAYLEKVVAHEADYRGLHHLPLTVESLKIRTLVPATSQLFERHRFRALSVQTLNDNALKALKWLRLKKLKVGTFRGCDFWAYAPKVERLVLPSVGVGFAPNFTDLKLKSGAGVTGAILDQCLGYYRFERLELPNLSSTALSPARLKELVEQRVVVVWQKRGNEWKKLTTFNVDYSLPTRIEKA